MAEKIWFIVSIIGFVLAGAFLILSVVIFFTQNIIAVIGELSGRTAAKQIAKIRETTNANQKKHVSNVYDIANKNDSFKKNVQKPSSTNISLKLNKTAEIKTQDIGPVNSFKPEIVQETTVLGQSNSNTVFNETTILSDSNNSVEEYAGTTLLEENYQETTVLNNQIDQNNDIDSVDTDFIVSESNVIINTDEVI